MKKYLRLMAILLLSAITCLSACKPQKQDESSPPDVSIDNNLGYDEMEGVDLSSDKLYFTKDGQALYTIVISKNADECEQYAAEELSSFVAQATGVAMPIVTDQSISYNLSQKYISIGDTALFDEAREQGKITADFSTFNTDGFIIKTIENNVFICGDISRGTLYGVYDLLEKFGGIRFLTQEYTHVPKADAFYMYQSDIVEIPTFAVRNYMSDSVIAYGDFMTRMRFRSEYGANDPKYGYGFASECPTNGMHNFFKLVPKATYWATHPEWYDHKYDSTVLCMTNGIKDGKLDETMEESVMKTILEELKKQFLSAPTIKYLVVAQEDHMEKCVCPNCVESDAKYGTVSGTLIQMLNVLSDELLKWRDEVAPERELYLVTLAYEPTEPPPAKKQSDGSYVATITARDNIIVKVAPIQHCYYHPLNDPNCEKQTIDERIKGWQTVCKEFHIWDYGVNYYGFFFWLDNFNVLKENALFYRDINVSSVMTQGANQEKNLYQEKLRVYLTSKLYWNPERDVNRLIEEFNYYFFGKEIGQKVLDTIEYASAYYAMKDATIERGYHFHVYEAWNVLEADHYSVAFLEGFMDRVDLAFDVMENMKNTLTEEDYERINMELCGLRLYPMGMILKNYTSYYDPSTRDAFAREYFSYADQTKITYYRVSQTFLMYKSEFDLYE